MHTRTMGRATAAHSVTFHNALEPTTFGRSNDVNIVNVLKQRSGECVTHINFFIAFKTYFADNLLRIQPFFLK